MAELSDAAATNLLKLENLTEPRFSRSGDGSSDAEDALGGFGPEKRLDFATAHSQEMDMLSELEENIATAIKTGRAASAAEMIRIVSQHEDATSVARLVWRALLDAPSTALHAAMDLNLVVYTFVDDINSRTCLHEAALAGHLELVQACVHNKVDGAKKDVYGRTPLSYAAMNGHAAVCTYLLTLPEVDPCATDVDGFTPLVLAVMDGRTTVVKILLDHGVSVEPREATEVIPLCLACQGGHSEITKLLLEKGAKNLVNVEGLTPQALAARAGYAACLRLLMEAKANSNIQEKGTLRTPLFFAAENGHEECIRVLLEAGCDAGAVDDKSRNAAFYAAWRGHINCLCLLLEHTDKVKRFQPEAHRHLNLQPRKQEKIDNDDSNMEVDTNDIDGIPSLSLPPPIIPFRTYGHNYLDKRALVSVSFNNRSVVLYQQQGDRTEKFPTSSLKLVMTSRPDTSTTAIPHNIILPLADEREVFSFQVESLDKLSIEWELMPTFGSKVIGKAVALPSSFEDVADSKKFVLPLQDMYLKVVGEISFELGFIKPFDRVQLEIGGRVETYWKSTLPSTAVGTSASNVAERMTPIDATTAPAAQLATSSKLGTPPTTAQGGSTSTVVTASSLSGEHLQVVVQVTKDGVAVVYPKFSLPFEYLDIYVKDITSKQFKAYAQGKNKELQIPDTKYDAMSLDDWKKALEGKMITLESLLEVLPTDVGVALDVLYPTSDDIHENANLRKIEVNQFVDSILHSVYHAGTQDRQRSRKIIFSSRCPTVCTALNWKQPNYAVFFASFCGLARTSARATLLASPEHKETDPRCQSVSEAVRFANNSNLLGIMVDAYLLNHVPQLIHSIKASGLLLITIGRYAPKDYGFSYDASINNTLSDESAADSLIDGSVEDGLVQCRS